MREFQELLDIAHTLNSPEGCPWDREQTFATLRPYVLEEAYEVLEAVDQGNDADIIEELGDLFYTVIFYAKVAERDQRFSIQQVIEELKNKLIRRHPHVFGDAKADTMEDVLKTWNAVKKEEKKERKSALEGIPKALPSLQRAQKILKHMSNQSFDFPKPTSRSAELAHQILAIVQDANEEGIDIESAVREILTQTLQSTQN